MTTPSLVNLEKMRGGPRDNALLSYALGNEWLKVGDSVQAAGLFREAVERDAHFSAAWKLLGKALAESGNIQAAQEAFEQGIRVAETRGDRQAAKEMQVFAKRLKKPGNDRPID